MKNKIIYITQKINYKKLAFRVSQIIATLVENLCKHIFLLVARINKNITLLLISVFIFTLIAGCNISTPKKLTQSDFYFDTIISITLYSNQDCEKIFDNCFALCEKYEQMLSKTISTSDVSKINTSNGNTVTVSEETSFLLEKALYYSKLSNGSYDISIAPVSAIWDFKNQDTPSIPNADDIETLLEYVDYKNIHLNNTEVTLAKPNVAIDLGSIAKGYIADKLQEYLSTEKAITGGVINLGGNVLAFGSKPDNTPWNIAIQKPFGEQNAPIGSITTSGISVVSSGIYERYFKINNSIYHHILDTTTGYPIDNNLYQVTIITPSSTDADALSTTCFSLGLEEGLALVESLENVEAIFIDSNYNITKSSGIDSLYNFKLYE